MQLHDRGLFIHWLYSLEKFINIYVFIRLELKSIWLLQDTEVKG